MPYDPRDEVTYDYIDERDYYDNRDYREREPPSRSREPPSTRPLPRETQAEYYARVSPGVYDEEGRRIQAKMDVINNPAVKMTPKEKAAINNPKLRMDSRGSIVSGTRVLYPPLKTRRTRKKTKMDRTLSRCLKMSNAKARKKNGSLKKGWNQRRIMKEAHRLCRKS